MFSSDSEIVYKAYNFTKDCRIACILNILHQELFTDIEDNEKFIRLQARLEVSIDICPAQILELQKCPFNRSLRNGTCSDVSIREWVNYLSNYHSYISKGVG